MSTTAYRSEEAILQARREDLLAARAAQRPTIEAMLTLGASQSVRRVAGLVGIGATLAVAVGFAFLSLSWSDAPKLLSIDPPGVGGALTLTIVAIPILTLLVATSGVLARAFAVRGAVRAFLRPTVDLRGDVARLESNSDIADLARRVQARSSGSLALLFTVAAIFLPLLVHLAVWIGIGIVGRPEVATHTWFDAFDQWIILSFWLMGLSYVVLVFRILAFRHRTLTVPAENLKSFGVRYGFATLGFTSLAACVPGAVLMFIPPVISFVTGLAVLPALFAVYGALVARDRRVVDAAFAAPDQ